MNRLTNRYLPLLALIVLTALNPPARAATPTGYDCQTVAGYDARLGFTLPGVVAKVLVQPGDKVTAGQVLAELDDHDARAALELARAAASSDLPARLARQRTELARLDAEWAAAEAAKDPAREDLKTTLAQARVRLEIAQLELEQAQQKITLARQAYEAARLRMEQLVLKAPRDGVVESLTVAPGETVALGQPVVRLIDASTLYVDVALPAEQTSTLSVGAPAQIVLKQAADKPLSGKIVQLSAVIQPETDTRRVRIQLENTQNWLPGSAVTVDFPAKPPS